MFSTYDLMPVYNNPSPGGETAASEDRLMMRPQRHALFVRTSAASL